MGWSRRTFVPGLRRLPLVRVTRWLVLASLALLAVLAAVVSLPIDFGWPPSVRWLARSLVGVGVVLGVLGTLTGASVLGIGRWVRTRLEAKPRRTQAVAAGLSLILFAAVATLPLALLLHRDPVTEPVVLQETAEIGLGETVAPWRIRQDAGGALWFVDDVAHPASDDLGRVAKDGSGIRVRPAVEDVEPGETLSIVDLTTVGTDAWVLLAGNYQRVTVFDEAGRSKHTYPLSGATSIEADASGHVWVLTVTGYPAKRAQLVEIDPVAATMRRISLPPTAKIDSAELKFDPAGSVGWLVTNPTADHRSIDIWSVRDGVVRPFTYQRPRLRYGEPGPPAFSVDRQGVLWIPIGSALLTVTPPGQSRFRHLGGTQHVEDLAPAPGSGMLLVVGTDGGHLNHAIAGERNYLVHVPAHDTKVFPAYFRLPDPMWIEGSARGRPTLVVGDEADVIVSVPGRHALVRFPQRVLAPAAVDCGGTTARVDRVTREALHPPETRRGLDTPVPDRSVAQWRDAFGADLRLEATATGALDALAPQLPVAAGPAADDLRETLRLQRASITDRLTRPATLTSDHYIASFRATVLDDTLISANGLRQVCGLPRLDFDRNTVWGAARRPDVQ